MKLSECTIGKLVELTSNVNGPGAIGHVVGLTLNIDLKLSEPLSNFETRNRTIPLVKFADEEFPRGIHPANLKEYKD